VKYIAIKVLTVLTIAAVCIGYCGATTFVGGLKKTGIVIVDPSFLSQFGVEIAANYDESGQYMEIKFTIDERIDNKNNLIELIYLSPNDEEVLIIQNPFNDNSYITSHLLPKGNSLMIAVVESISKDSKYYKVVIPAEF